MLDNKGFDLWADGYDIDVGITDDNNEYPFAGYKTYWEAFIAQSWLNQML